MRNVKRNTAQRSGFHDRSLLILISLMLLFGVIMIHNATVVYSQGVFGGAYRFVLLQLGWIAAGSLGFLFFYRYDYKKIGRVAYPMFALSLLSLGLLAFLGFLNKSGLIECSNSIIFAPCINGAYRWLYLNPPPLPKIPLMGVLGFQPSELAKLSLIMYLSVQLNKAIKERDNSFYVYLFPSGLVALFILLQPNMSTAALVFLIATSIYYSTGESLKPLLVTGPVLALTGLLFILTSPYRRDRLLTLIGTTEGKELSLGYHIKQILIALGSGGLFGVGFGQSRQKFQYLPEVSSDSIFAIIGEELGFAGTTVVVILFSLFIYKGFDIARNTPDLLGKMLAVGITSWIALQFFVNVAAMTKLIPLTGVPIPLISYGGSSMIFSLMGLGILANISREKV
ncbi:MAG: Cell division protein FtsW [candidate division WWE3 bacterium GW2011_GWC1_41_7]|uniref:Probable peptidoglycan glycosyltransferase FtsW n=1 Tax=candidate division WWE3 bacterium GW2011_GWC1_41_7 TaxID=1619119 RepID=A0A0G0XAD4_UNCKA|nr:MAG: Cell division protein FtsW [candidate division WWE3 bacterium GW2011_GWC1_41_7]